MNSVQIQPGFEDFRAGDPPVRQPIRVMIANDSAVIRRLVSEALLDAEGFEVYPAINGSDAVNQLQSARPDVLVLDTEMPVMNGVQTIRAIRELDTILPIIMLCLSTESSLLAMAQAIPAGANDVAKFTLRMGHVASAKKMLRDELLPKIRFWADIHEQKLIDSPTTGTVALSSVETGY